MHPGTILTYTITDKNLPNGDSNGDFMKKHIYAVTPRDVGGIGDLIFDTIQFPDYEIDKEEGLLIPLYKEDSKVLNGSHRYLTGDQLLCSLYNFYDELNQSESTASDFEKVRKWCIDNVQPYYLRELYLELTDKNYSYGWNSRSVMKAGILSVEEFLNDCKRLYNHYSFYLAIEDLKKGKQRRAYNLYNEGGRSEGYDYFEGYKRKERPELPDLGLDEDMDIVELMKAEHAYWEAHPDEDDGKEITIETYRGFGKSPIKDLDYFYELLIEGFPTFKMQLGRIPQTNSTGLLVQVNSVFDIAWYAFASQITMNASPNEDYDLYKPRVCVACQKLFIPNGPRAEYCDETECQRARKRKNRRDYVERKKAQTITSRVPPEKRKKE